jgi:integrase
MGLALAISGSTPMTTWMTPVSEAGVPVDVIRDQLAHSNITMTNTYLGRSRDRLAQAAKQRTAMRARKAMRLARVGLSKKPKSAIRAIMVNRCND